MVRKIYVFVKSLFKKRNIASLKRKVGFFGIGVVIDGNYYFTEPKNIFLNDYVYIGPGAIIQSYDKVTISRGTIIGPRIRIYSGNHKFRNSDSLPYDNQLDLREVVIGENVWIGGDVIIVPGVIIGEGAVIGAGSVITGSVPSMAIYGGNPAKKIGERDSVHYFTLKAQDKIYMKDKFNKI